MFLSMGASVLQLEWTRKLYHFSLVHSLMHLLVVMLWATQSMYHWGLLLLVLAVVVRLQPKSVLWRKHCDRKLSKACPHLANGLENVVVQNSRSICRRTYQVSD